MAEQMLLFDGLPDQSKIVKPLEKPDLIKRFFRALTVLLEMPLKFLFGNDIFISYSRADGINYAEGLASQLAKRNFSCSLDLWETSPGAELPGKLKRTLRWSKMLILIGTEAAARSDNVELEIEEFIKTKGTLIPIDFNYAVERGHWFQLIRGLPVARERHVEALVSGKPSEGIISRIENSVKFTRRNQRTQRIFIASLLAFAVLIALNLLAAQSVNASRAEANKAQAAAEEQNRLAGEARKDADTQKQLARDAGEEKDKQMRLATEAKTEADKQRGLAETANVQRQTAERMTAIAVEREKVAARNAAEQQQIAYSNQLANRASTEAQEHLDLGLLLSAQAFDAYPTFESQRSLMSGLLLYPNLSTILRHGFRPVGAVKLSPDGKTLASLNVDGILRFWDAESRQPLGCPLNLPKEKRAGQDEDEDSADEDRLVLGLRVLIPALAFSPNGKILAATCTNDSICFWDVATREKLSEIYAGTEPTFIGNHQLATVERRAITFWDISDVRHPKSLDPFSIEDDVLALAVSPDLKTIALNQRNKIRLYDLASRQFLFELPTKHDETVESLKFSPKAESHLLVSVDVKGRVVLCNTATRKPIILQERSAEETGQSGALKPNAYHDVAFNSDGSLLGFTGADGTIIIWSVTNPPKQYEGKEYLAQYYKGVYKNGVTSFAFDDKDRSLVLANFDGTLGFWALDRVQPLGRTFPRPKRLGFSEKVTVSSDGQWMASGSDNGRVFLWRVATDEQPQPLPDEHKTVVDNLAFSSDDKKLATSDYNRNIILWDVMSKSVLGKKSLPVVRNTRGEDLRVMLTSLTFHPHNSDILVAASGDGTVTLWNIRNPQKFEEIVTYEGEAKKVAFSLDGKRMATGGLDGTILLWDLTKPKPTARPLPGTNAEVLSLSFAPDGLTLISVHSMTDKEAGAIILWNLAGRPLTQQRFVLGEITWQEHINISPDGRTLAVIRSVSNGVLQPSDNQVLLWDIASHSMLGQFPLNHADIFSIFSSDGKRLISVSDDTMTVSDVSPDLWLNRVCQTVRRGLNSYEQTQFLENKSNRIICAEMSPSTDCPKQ